MSTPSSSIPIGSWVLVTGATGFIASHVVRQFLHRGYKVRGTVRDVAQASWLIDEHFKSYAESNSFELAVVPDLSIPGAFDEAVKGMSAVAHIAAITSFDPDPNKIIPPSIAGIQAIMSAAAKEPSVKEVVFTSSIMAVKLPVLSDEPIRVGRDTWNDYVMELASAPPPYDASNSMNAYAAGKVAAEKEVWRWIEENKPKFNINVICPFGVLGEPLHKKHVDTPANWVATIFKGGKEQLDAFPASKSLVSSLPCPSYLLKDCRLLHGCWRRCNPACSRHLGPGGEQRATSCLGPSNPLERLPYYNSQASTSEGVYRGLAQAAVSHHVY